MKKLLLVFVAMMVTSVLSAQQNIKLTVHGQGATKEEATANALRSAIEQAFGVFVSANTQILNDEIVKDEIATIASGNIKEYQELGCVTLPSGDLSVSLAATVSLSNLISYSKSKGSSAEFAGATFAMNMKMRKLNAANEITALYSMLEQLYILAPSVFDWNLETGEPLVLSENQYEIPMIAKAKVNNNTSSFFSLLLNTLESLSLSPSEVEGYKTNNMEVYSLKINNREFILRNDYRAFTTYVEYLINCVAESFHIYGQFGNQKAKLLYDLKYEHFTPFQLIKLKRIYNSDPYAYEIKNLDMLISGDTGSEVFQRSLSVCLNEDTLYQVYGFEVVPAPNISRISFVQKNGIMAVDTMNVYQSADFDPEGNGVCREAFKHMRVLYVSEDCPARRDKLSFYNHDSLQTIIVERVVKRQNERSNTTFEHCDNLETVRIGGKGLNHIWQRSFNNTPKLSTVIIGSTLTYGDKVIDLMALTEKDIKDLQGVIIFGDEVKSIDSNTFGSGSESKNSLSVVFNRNVKVPYGIDFYPSAKFAIWLNASKPNEFYLPYMHCNLVLVPKECLSYFQNKYPYESQLFSPLEDKMSGLGYVDFLSFLKMLLQETINVE